MGFCAAAQNTRNWLGRLFPAQSQCRPYCRAGYWARVLGPAYMAHGRPYTATLGTPLHADTHGRRTGHEC